MLVLAASQKGHSVVLWHIRLDLVCGVGKNDSKESARTFFALSKNSLTVSSAERKGRGTGADEHGCTDTLPKAVAAVAFGLQLG